MTTIPTIENVSYDPAKRRFLDRVLIAKGLWIRTLDVAAPGHPSWGYRRIAKALARAAETTMDKMKPQHAGA